MNFFFISIIADGEERSMIEPGMINNYDYQELRKILINWINDELRFECSGNFSNFSNFLNHFSVIIESLLKI